MERLKPLDLEKIQFRRSVRGYDPQQVDDVCKRAAKEIETLLAELKEARDAAERANEKLGHYLAQENTLKEALVLAQKTADETRALAQKEAEHIREKAQADALATAEQFQERINDLRWDLERIRLERQKFIVHFKAVLQEQLQALDEGRSAQFAFISLDQPSTELPTDTEPEAAAS
jgi:cell division initiation protein